MSKIPLLVVLALAVAGCDQSRRETSTGGYPSYESYLKAHQKGQVAQAQTQPAPVMTEDGSYAATDDTVTTGTIGADTLAALKATSGTAQ